MQRDMSFVVINLTKLDVTRSSRTDLTLEGKKERERDVEREGGR